MSRDRFVAPTKCIRFNNMATRAERRAVDKLAPIRCIFDMFVENFKRMMYPESHMTVDEHLLGFRGRAPFRVYMKSKPDKYGMKLWALCDAANAGTHNLQVYLGKQNNSVEKNQGKRVVLDMVQHLSDEYGITTDNFFTSESLGDKLLAEHLTLCGTVRKNKTFIPEELLPSKTRPFLSSTFVFTKDHTLVPYSADENKAVILLSTEHTTDKISDEAHSYKPEMVLHYNMTKELLKDIKLLMDDFSMKIELIRGMQDQLWTLLQNTGRKTAWKGAYIPRIF
ncbi:hypothetical protein JTB14_038341 [Gonioctena quinquepunctata]|nr:hypothetical protein JTB14_038341 [Gonioctena quinquepunctata]